jgi:hypothetical protein
MFEDLVKYTSKAVESRRVVETFFGNFFAIKDYHGESIVKFDSRDVARGIAPYVAPTVKGKPVKIAGFSSNILELPTMKPNEVLTNDDIKKRPFGDTVDTKVSKSARARKFATEITDRNMAKIDARLEQMRAEEIFTGKLIIKGDGYDHTITFPRRVANIVDLGGSKYWDLSTSTVGKDFGTMIALAGEYGKSISHVVGRIATMETTVARIKTEEGANYVDSSAQMQNITFKSMADVDGAIYYGKFRNVEMWGYDGNYQDIDGSWKKSVPDKKVAFMASKNFNEESYGYAGDVEIELGLNTKNKVKNSNNIITSIKPDDVSVEFEAQLTAAPLMKDGDTAIIVTVIS